MELNNIEEIVKKYFEGETSISEEKELRDYFSSQDVAPHLVQYTDLFTYFATAKKEQFAEDITKVTVFKDQKKDKKPSFYWISIAASFVILLGIGTYLFYASDSLNKDKDFGTYDDPKVAFEATQKALSLLSNKVNAGIESVQYVEEYQNTKNRIFNNNENNSEGM